MEGFNTVIKKGSHGSSGSEKHPYLKSGNSASKTFAEIAKKRANKKGIPLMDEIEIKNLNK